MILSLYKSSGQTRKKPEGICPIGTNSCTASEVLSVRYEGTETVNLPESVGRDTVHDRIDAWLGEEPGSYCRIRRESPDEIVLKRKWNENTCRLIVGLVVLGSVFRIVSGSTVPSIHLLVFMLTSVVLGSIVLIAYLFFLFPSRTVIKVSIEESQIGLNLESSQKEESEQDFDSLIRAIQEG